MALSVLPTTVVGSYSMPAWLERAKTDFLSRKVSRHDLDEMHDAAVKAAIKDQEAAGVDVVTDGEMRRDNMIDYFAERIPGVQIDHRSKRFYYDYYESAVRGRLPVGSLGMAPDFQFLASFTDREAKVCLTGPHTLAKRIRNEHYPSEEAFAEDLARILNREVRELARAGARHLQVDEPYLSGFPEDLPWAVRVLNVLLEGVDGHVTLHVCYGNRYGKPSFEGSYRSLFPAILGARVQALALEFGRRGEEDLILWREFKPPFDLGLGVVDVKTPDVEPPDVVADRIRKAFPFVPPERIWVNPDCGLHHLPRDAAFAKLKAMVEGTRLVRRELGR